MPRHTVDRPADPRRTEVAKLLATGFLRFHRRILTATSPASESAQNCLDVSPETSLNAATEPAVNAGGDPESEGTYVQD
jgi:hypothetical protein